MKKNKVHRHHNLHAAFRQTMEALKQLSKTLVYEEVEETKSLRTCSVIAGEESLKDALSFIKKWREQKEV